MPKIRTKFILALDVGTHSIKAALFDKSGEMVACQKISQNKEVPTAGWVEKDPEELWNSIIHLITTFLAEQKITKFQIACLVFATQMCGSVVVDMDGRPIGACILCSDNRSAPTLRKAIAGRISFFGGYGPMRLLEWLIRSNGAPDLSGRDTFSKHLWQKQKCQHDNKAVRFYLDIKDYLLFKCSNLAITSPDVAHFTWLCDYKKQNWSRRLMAKYDFDIAKLPKIKPAMSLVESGLCRDAVEALGLGEFTSLAVGSSDVVANAVGTSVSHGFGPHIYLGTSSWLAAHVNKSRVLPRFNIATINSPMSGKHLLIGAQENAGSMLEQIASIIGLSGGVEELVKIAENSPAGSNDVMCLPWLVGERAPKNASKPRGGILNIKNNTTIDDIARAAIEALAYNQLWLAKYFAKACDFSKHTKIPVSGGLANSELILQTLADTFQMKIVRVRDPQWVGVKGAFYCAAVAIGWSDKLEPMTSETNIDEVFNPNAACRAVHQRRFTSFCNFFDTIT